MSQLFQSISEKLKPAINPLLYSLAAFGAYKLASLVPSAYKKLTHSPPVPLELGSRYGKGSWCLITGAANGIGEAWAKELAKRGFNIVLVDIDESVVSKGEDLKQTFSIETKCMVLNLKEYSAVDRIEEETRGLDISILVNNVGVATFQDFYSVTEADYLETIDINLISIVRLTHRLLPSLLKRNPRSAIIFVSSSGGVFGAPYASVYSGTKGFLRFFALSLSREIYEKADTLILEPFGVSTNMVNLPVSEYVASSEETVIGALEDLGYTLETPGSSKHKRVMKTTENFTVEERLEHIASITKTLVKQTSKTE